jgi:hypothetical protein
VRGTLRNDSLQRGAAASPALTPEQHLVAFVGVDPESREDALDWLGIELMRAVRIEVLRERCTGRQIPRPLLSTVW